MTTSDRYCLNCKQMVQPKSRPHQTPLTIAYALYAVTAYQAWGSEQFLLILVVGAAVAALIGGMIGGLAPHRTCPICKTENLSKSAPTPA